MNPGATLAQLQGAYGVTTIRWPRWRIRETPSEIWVISKGCVVVCGKIPGVTKRARRLGNADARRVFARKLRFARR